MPANQSSTLILDLTSNEIKYGKHIQEKNGMKIIPLGILPGLNSNIDLKDYSFTKDLLHNFTFTDLQPVSYDLKMFEGLKEIFKTGSNAWDLGWQGIMNINVQQATEAFKKKFVGNLYEYNEASNNTVNKVVVEILRNHLGNFIKDGEIPVLRLIGSQDSVYSETLQNRFGDNNIFDEMSATPIVNAITHTTNYLKSKITSQKAGMALTGIAQVASIAQKIGTSLPKYSYESGIQLMKELSTSNSLLNLFKKEMLGLQISLPRVFESSTYSESLNIFIRLTSPTGHPNDIKSYILAPIIILLTAAAPLSFDNITYGYPPIWKIRSYGNSYQTVGVFDVITISRGSMETTYSDDLMPLSVDVRITLTSLSHHYASILADGMTYNGLIGQDGIGFSNQATTAEGILFKTDNEIKPDTKITISL